MAETKETKTPVFKTRRGAVSASVWKNEVKTDKGTFENYTVTLQKGYKDKNDEWQNSQSFSTNDLPKVQLVVSECYDWILKGGDNE